MKRFPITALSCFAATAAVATLPVPAHAQRLTGTPAPSFTNPKASVKKQEPLTGFQDIKWGDSIAKATKILESKGATVGKAVGSDNALQISNLKVAGYETKLVKLRFGSEGFYQANVDFSSRRIQEEVNMLSDLQMIIAERFGDATPDRAVGGLSGGSGQFILGAWRFNQPNQEAASLILTANPSAEARLEYRATARAEREEGRIRAEKAKSL